MKKVVHEDQPEGALKFMVGASPGFRTVEFVDTQTGDYYVFTFSSIIAAQLARHLMEGEPDPEQLSAEKTDAKVVTFGGR